MRKIWLPPVLFIAALVALAVLDHASAPPSPSGFLAPPALAAPAMPELAPDDRVLGKAEAPVTIFEYASLTCPHCAAFDQETLPKIKENWIDTGKAKLVFRDYPLDQAALKAAMLARCAPPGRFYGFIDVLFQSQTTWARSGDIGQALARIGKLGGISQEQFDACMADKKLQDQVVASRLQGEKQYGVDSTPTFFINGTKVVGEQPYSEFEKVLGAAAKS